MELSDPHRYAFFPPSQIFGRKMVPLYYLEEAPIIPLSAVAGVLGVSFRTVLNVAKKNLEVLPVVDVVTGEDISDPVELESRQKVAGVGMEGLGIVIFSLEHDRIEDEDARQRLMTAKLWLAVQISNRLKRPGRRNQPRWDAGLNKRQARLMKKRFAQLQKVVK
jgi:hypothetical protein